jgi:predicted translin family RNA/ssDNA-binding protein
MVDLPAEKLSLEALGVSDQAYVNGLADLPSELAKAVLDWRALRAPTMEEEIFILERFLNIARDIVTFLASIEGVPEKYLATSSREGDYRGTFYGKLVGAKRLLVEHRAAFEQLRLLQRLEKRLNPPVEASI